MPGAPALDATIPDLGFEEDAGEKDADPIEDADAGVAEDAPDMGPRDMGPRDVDPEDIPMPRDANDAEPIDVGLPDTGVFEDAQPVDTGEEDAGFLDAQPIDAGFDRTYGVATMRNAGVDLDEVRPGNMNLFLRSIPTTASSNRPTWAPSATRIAFQTTRADQAGNLIQQVEIFAENGTFIDAFDGREPDWSHDLNETRIAAASAAGDAVIVHPVVLGLDQSFPESEPEQITWDPSGALRLAYTVAATLQRRDLYVRDLSVTRFRVLQNARNFAWAPSGNSMAVVDGMIGNCRIADAIINATSVGAVTTWISGVNCEGTRLAWSPNGRQLAIVQQAPGMPGSLYVISSNTARNTPLQNLIPLLTNLAQILDLEWTPDGEYLAMSRAAGSAQSDLILEPIADRSWPAGMLAPQFGPGRFALRPVN